MKLKAGDPGSGRARIFLDGIERTHVIAADEEGRTITRIKTDENGDALVDRIAEDYRYETLRGDVAIVIGPRAPFDEGCRYKGSS